MHVNEYMLTSMCIPCQHLCLFCEVVVVEDGGDGVCDGRWCGQCL